jgi:hypothetical protein
MFESLAHFMLDHLPSRYSDGRLSGHLLLTLHLTPRSRPANSCISTQSSGPLLIDDHHIADHFRHHADPRSRAAVSRLVDYRLPASGDEHGYLSHLQNDIQGRNRDFMPQGDAVGLDGLLMTSPYL